MMAGIFTSTLKPSLSCSSLGVPRAHFGVSLFSLNTSRRHLSYLPFANAIPQLHSFGLRASKLSQIGGNNLTLSSAVQNASQAAALGFVEENVLEWIKMDTRRMLHIVYRVKDIDRTIKFYTECLGMKLLRRRDFPDDRYGNAFLGYGLEDSHFVIELICSYNDIVDQYNDFGSGFGHLSIAVNDLPNTVQLIKAKGGMVATRKPWGKTVITDPDGYKFVLIVRASTPEPLCQVTLQVGNLDRSIEFYKQAFGMNLFLRWGTTRAVLGYGPKDKSPVLELVYDDEGIEHEKGNGYVHIAIGTSDVYKTSKAVELCGGKIIRKPGPLPGSRTKITACLDPDGWKFVFVDNTDFLRELQ